MNQEVAGFFSFGMTTQPKQGKAKNGDALAAGRLHGDWVVLCLADGVGSRSCDWLASDTACSVFIAQCGALPEQDDIPGFLSAVVEKIDTDLSETKGGCQGLLSCFTAFVWKAGSPYAWFLNVGDTRIYQSCDGNITQLSVDDASEVVVRDRQGKVKLFAEGVVVRSGITRALGMGHLRVEVQRTDLPKGALVLMSTDGFYGCSSQAMEVLGENCSRDGDLGKAIKKTFDQFQNQFIDDATVAVFRRHGMEADEAYQHSEMNDPAHLAETLPGFVASEMLLNRMEAELRQHNYERCLNLLNVLNDKGLKPSGKAINNLLISCMQAGTGDAAVVNGLVELLRKVMM